MAITYIKLSPYYIYFIRFYMGLISKTNNIVSPASRSIHHLRFLDIVPQKFLLLYMKATRPELIIVRK